MLSAIIYFNSSVQIEQWEMGNRFEYFEKLAAGYQKGVGSVDEIRFINSSLNLRKFCTGFIYCF